MPSADAALPADVARRFGPRVLASPMRLGPRTWRMSIDGRPVVAKRMSWCHRPTQFRQLMLEVENASIGCPRLLDCLERGACWFAVFEFVEGQPLNRAPAHEAVARGVFALLERLARVPPPPASRNVEREWLARVAPLGVADPAAARLLDDLEAHRPTGRLSVTHGDVAPQNLLDTSSGLVLIDWEEAGVARPGFDAGWLLALNRVGAGLRVKRSFLIAHATDAGVPISNAVWFEKLGLLRLQWRATSLLASHPGAAGILDRVRAAVAASASGAVV